MIKMRILTRMIYSYKYKPVPFVTYEVPFVLDEVPDVRIIPNEVPNVPNEEPELIVALKK